MLKLDTQGHEWQVISGATSSLHRLCLIQLEASLQALYHNERLLPELLARLIELDFRLVGIEPGLPHGETGELLQADLLMARANRGVDNGRTS